MDPKALSSEVAAVEEELSALQARAERESSSLAALESQLAQVHERLAETTARVEHNSRKLAQKRGEAAEAERAAAAARYQEAVRTRDDAAARFAEAATSVVAELDAYEAATEGLRRLVEEMGHPTADATLENDPDILFEAWSMLEERVRQRIAETLEDELVEEAARSAMGRAIEDLPEHLREVAHARRRARIKAHLAKT
jgi:SMC interacting uncharacterized protein involved in chromosome segregation